MVEVVVFGDEDVVVDSGELVKVVPSGPPGSS